MIRKTLPGPTAHGLCICRAPVAPAQSRRCVSMRADQTPDKSSAASSSATSSQPTEPSDNPFSLSQVVGSYGIIGLFTSALVLAGYKGFQAAQTNPEDVGVLLAPPGAALLLMATFFVYRFASKDDFDY